jgi:hypothetical protein
MSGAVSRVVLAAALRPGAVLVDVVMQIAPVLLADRSTGR